MTIGRRFDCLHKALVPRRTELSILHTADRILSRTTEHVLAMGVIESVFDYQSRWFGRAVNMPQAPAWESASTESLRFASALAENAVRREINPALRDAVGKARQGKARKTIAQAIAAPQK